MFEVKESCKERAQEGMAGTAGPVYVGQFVLSAQADSTNRLALFCFDCACPYSNEQIRIHACLNGIDHLIERKGRYFLRVVVNPA